MAAKTKCRQCGTLRDDTGVATRVDASGKTVKEAQSKVCKACATRLLAANPSVVDDAHLDGWVVEDLRKVANA